MTLGHACPEPSPPLSRDWPGGYELQERLAWGLRAAGEAKVFECAGPKVAQLVSLEGIFGLLYISKKVLMSVMLACRQV